MPSRVPLAIISRARRAVIATAGAIAFVSVAGCAAAGPYNPDELPQSQLGQIEELCSGVMGVEQGDARGVACVGSLSDASRNVGRGQALQSAREACEREGLRPGSADMATCIVEQADTAPASFSPVAAVGPEPGLRKSYPYASNNEIHRREELSCARLGLDPAGEGFSSCVASLDLALFNADNPMQ